MRVLLFFWALLLLITAGAASAQKEEDLFEESEYIEFQERPVDPESAVQLPRWPVIADSIEVRLGLENFPFTVLIDPASLSVEAGRVVRYTVILKSVNASMNVSYEAINCADSKYRRYAYGSQGVFKPVRDSRWMYIVSRDMGGVRQALMKAYLCPVPGRGHVERLLKRIQTDRSSLLEHQQEE